MSEQDTDELATPNDTENDTELRDKLKFSILVPFATHLEPMYQADMLFKQNIVVDGATAYNIAIDKLEALIADRVREAEVRAVQEFKERIGMYYKDEGFDEAFEYIKELQQLKKEG